MRLKRLFGRRRTDDELACELETYIEIETAENISRGMEPHKARSAAFRKLGSRRRVREEVYAMNTIGFLETLAQDLKYAVRMLRKSPGFTAVAVLTLALGIGANTAIFSLMNVAMLRSMPVPDPQQLVMLQYAGRQDPNTMGSYFWRCPEKTDPARHEGCSFSHPMYEQIHAQQTVFSGLSAFIASEKVHMAADGLRTMVRTDFVGGDFFSTLRLGAELGRTLEPADDTPGAPPVAVLRDGYWRREFGGEPSVIGKSISLEGVSVVIVGVVTRGFTGLDAGLPDDIWLPLSSLPRLLPGRFRWDMRSSLWTEMVARLKPSVSRTQAESAITAIFAPSVTTGPEAIFKRDDAPHIELPELSHGLGSVRQEFSKPLFVLMAAVGIILLLTIVNTAGLMLARAASRSREIAVRPWELRAAEFSGSFSPKASSLQQPRLCSEFCWLTGELTHLRLSLHQTGTNIFKSTLVQT